MSLFYKNYDQLQNITRSSLIYNRIKYVDVKFARDIPVTDKENFAMLKENTEDGE